MSELIESSEIQRTDRINVVSELRKCFKHDKACVYYRGAFTDDFTDKLISIAEFELEKKTKRKMAFFVAESFQNIVRHGVDVPEQKELSLFGVRGIGSYLHVYSSNLVEKSDKEVIETALNKIDSLNAEELDQYYRKLLEDNVLSEKGGAGLGFVSMVRKSKNPVQSEFIKKGDLFSFNLQIDFKNGKDLSDVAINEQPLGIGENTALYNLTLDFDIVFLYNGEFTDEIISSMLSIIEENEEGANSSVGFVLYHAAVEMMQNVTRHGKEVKDVNDGIFAILKTDKGYYMCSGNYIESNGEEISDVVNSLNSKTKSELTELYRTTLKKSVHLEGNNAGVGLIDLKRSIDSLIDMKIGKDINGNYLMMGLEINI